MTDTSQTTLAHRGVRPVVLQAIALLGALVPLAALASYALADLAGALQPASAGALTLGIGLVGAGAILIALGNPDRFPHPRLGLCNGVTLTRAAGIAVMAGQLMAPLQGLGWGLVALAGLVLALDAVDGWAARRAGLQSRFGARLDVESDVAFALTLAALAVALGQVGPWFLALGLLRPSYLAAGRIIPALRAPLPDAQWRKRLAALQMTAQVVLIAPIVAPPVSSALGAAILGAMVLSFGFDIRGQLIRARP
ncbi:MAG: CDP-alcohol phosphatidyltransferase family protein [Roseinatronobacter sp.]